MELLKPNYINVVGLGGWRTLLDRRGIGMIFSFGSNQKIIKSLLSKSINSLYILFKNINHSCIVL